MQQDRWRRATYSHPDNHCVEVSVTEGTALVRDSKDSAGPRLHLTLRAFYGLLTSVAADQQDPLVAWSSE